MKKIAPLVILIAGIVLLVMGINASDSLGSEISEAVNGAPNDKSIWLIIVGAIGTLFGGLALMRRT